MKNHELLVSELSGRERHVLLKALAIAIRAIDATPERRRPKSDRDDMSLLFRGTGSEVEQQIYTREARWLLEGGVR